jgi:hypothetical protein
VAEAGNEHRVVDGLGDRVAPPGQQRGGDGALVTLQDVVDARVDRVAQALHERGIAQRQAAAGRRLLRLDGAHHKAGGADALKIEVAAEIVGARPQRRQRRLQPQVY